MLYAQARRYAPRIVSYYTLPGIRIRFTLSYNTGDTRHTHAQIHASVHGTAAAIVPARIPKVSYGLRTPAPTLRTGSPD